MLSIERKYSYSTAAVVEKRNLRRFCQPPDFHIRRLKLPLAAPVSAIKESGLFIAY
jgi:hypothetical protein